MFKFGLAFLLCLSVPVCAESTAPKALVPLLYQVKKDGSSGYILGTQHVGIDLAMLPSQLIKLFEKAQSLTVEIDNELAPRRESFFEQATSLYNWWGPRLSEQLSPRAWTNFLRITGLTPSKADTLSAYGANLRLLRAQLKTESAVEGQVRQGTTPSSMDEFLARRAKSAGAELQYLETRESQSKMLKQALNVDYLERSLAPAETLNEAWFFEGEEPGLEALARSEQKWSSWWKLVIKDRNEAWLPKLLSSLSRPGLNVVAVGAMHLPTDDGVLALLRAHGFEVTRIHFPDCESALK